MELRQLRAFVKGAETLNFSLSARELCVTQSTYSQCIRQLEDELGVALFLRNTRKVALTEAGMELLPYARATLAQAENCNNRIRDLLGMSTGTLTIGVTHSFSQMLTETVSRFVKTYPGIRLEIIYKSMDELMESLLQREVDIVLSFKSLKSKPQIESHHLFTDNLSAIVRNDHPLADCERVTLDMIRRYPLILATPGLQAREALDRLLEVKGETIEAAIETNQVTAILRLVHSAGMVTLLSSASVDYFSDLKAIPLDECPTEMQGAYHLLRDNYRKASVDAFIEMIKSSPVIVKLRMDTEEV